MVILAMIAILEVGAIFVIEQEVVQGKCKARIEKDILVPIGPNCYPTIIKRKRSNNYEIYYPFQKREIKWHLNY